MKSGCARRGANRQTRARTWPDANAKNTQVRHNPGLPKEQRGHECGDPNPNACCRQPNRLHQATSEHTKLRCLHELLVSAKKMNAMNEGRIHKRRGQARFQDHVQTQLSEVRTPTHSFTSSDHMALKPLYFLACSHLHSEYCRKQSLPPSS